MPDPFFSSGPKNKKRKRPPTSVSQPSAAKKVKRKGTKPNETSKSGQTTKKRKTKDVSGESSDELEPSLDFSDDGGDDVDQGNDSQSGDEYEHETPAEKRLRLAKLYLESVKTDLADGEFDAAEIDKEIISSRLKQDVLEHSGKVHWFIAASYDHPTSPVAPTSAPLHRNILVLKKGHRFSITACAASENGAYLWTSGKEGSIVKWDMSSGQRLHTARKVIKGKRKAKEADAGTDGGHSDEVLALAVSGDGKFVVSSGRDRKTIVWDADTMRIVKEFSGMLSHRDTVSTLSFRKSTNQLYTASFDRTIKLYDLSPNVMGYVETLFGHQDSVLALDALRGETCVTVGGRDKTARYWKIRDETQLVFRGGGKSKLRDVLDGGAGGDTDHPLPNHKNDKNAKNKEQFVEGSLECVAMIDEHTFLTGGDSGSISLWSTQKKKPIYSRPLCHGLQITHSSTEGVIHIPRWITSLASLHYSDLFASGSYDSSIRLWKLSSNLNSFEPLATTIPSPGVINALQFITPPKDFWTSAKWTEGTPTTATKGVDGATANVAKPLLLVAAVGQEHRLGRWLSIKGTDGAGGGEKAQNCCRVVALMPSTSPRTSNS